MNEASREALSSLAQSALELLRSAKEKRAASSADVERASQLVSGAMKFASSDHTDLVSTNLRSAIRQIERQIYLAETYTKIADIDAALELAEPAAKKIETTLAAANNNPFTPEEEAIHAELLQKSQAILQMRSATSQVRPGDRPDRNNGHTVYDADFCLAAARDARAEGKFSRAVNLALMVLEGAPTIDISGERSRAIDSLLDTAQAARKDKKMESAVNALNLATVYIKALYSSVAIVRQLKNGFFFETAKTIAHRADNLRHRTARIANTVSQLTGNGPEATAIAKECRLREPFLELTVPKAPKKSESPVLNGHMPTEIVEQKKTNGTAAPEYFLVPPSDFSSHIGHILASREPDTRSEQWVAYGEYIAERLSISSHGVVVITHGKDLIFSATISYLDEVAFRAADRKLRALDISQLQPIDGSNSVHSIPAEAMKASKIREPHYVYATAIGDMSPGTNMAMAANGADTMETRDVNEAVKRSIIGTTHNPAVRTVQPS